MGALTKPIARYAPSNRVEKSERLVNLRARYWFDPVCHRLPGNEKGRVDLSGY